MNRPFAAYEIVSVQNWRLPAAIFNEHLSYVHDGCQVACHIIPRPADGIDLQRLAWEINMPVELSKGEKLLINVHSVQAQSPERIIVYQATLERQIILRYRHRLEPP